MAKRISGAARAELVRAIGERYREATRDDKARILDEFVAITGHHRKHAIRVIRATAAGAPAVPAIRKRMPLYDQAVRDALVVLWEAADRVCGKRLKPLLPLLVGAPRAARALATG